MLCHLSTYYGGVSGDWGHYSEILLQFLTLTYEIVTLPIIRGHLDCSTAKLSALGI